LLRRAGGLGFLVFAGGLVVYRVDECGEVGCGFGAHAGQDVLVGGHGESGVGVAESFRHDLDRYPVGDEERGVAQIVESDSGQARFGDDAGEELADRFGVQRLATGVREDRVVRAGSDAVESLAGVPCSQAVFGGGVEVDTAATGAGLGRELGGPSRDDLANGDGFVRFASTVRGGWVVDGLPSKDGITRAVARRSDRLGA
jgi:hypothetical protein